MSLLTQPSPRVCSHSNHVGSPRPTRGHDERIALAFQICLSRLPTTEEHRILLETLHSASDRFHKDRSAADKLLSVGRTTLRLTIAPHELAAWTTVTSMLLNLDETISKT